jgi:DNA polymerase alpha subunit A
VFGWLIGQDEEDKIPEIPASDVAQGVLPKIIATLVNRRRAVKGLMKDKSAPAARMMQVSSTAFPVWHRR